jgi:hypothetical protein
MSVQKITTRQAILAAADHIEKWPDLYDDTSTAIPWSLREPASAKGWIGYFAGMPPNGLSTVRVEFGALGYDNASGFHHDMEAVCRAMGWRGWLLSWRSNAKLAARCLRRYADERYGERVAA